MSNEKMNKRFENIENEIIPAVALRGLTVFPDAVLHFDVGREKSVRALENALENNKPIFLVTQKDIRQDDPQAGGLYKYGTLSYVRQLMKIPGGNLRAMVQGVCRAAMLEFVGSMPFITVKAIPVPDTISPRMGERSEAAARVLKSLWARYADVTKKVSEDARFFVETEDDSSKLADFIAQNMMLQYKERQKILSELRPYVRVELLCKYLSHEISIAELESTIGEKLQNTLTKSQRDYYIREQVKVLKEELGEGEDTEAEAEFYTKKIKALKLARENEDKLVKEAERLGKMAPMSPESGVIRTYLDTVLDIPWNKRTDETRDIMAATAILDKEFYGMEKVKERILEFLAVRQLNPELRGQVICLVGPPGTGKTSIGTMIATATGRQYARISLGGMRDEADIRGHRKTYIGAMPGRIINALRQAGSSNPVLLLDEIDKMGNDFRGDPASAMLEVLDIEQNSRYLDHYLEIPIDLSDVLFIMTANTTETIPRPLLDRMEMIELGSYTDEEKFEIAKRHLLPRQMTRHGLDRNSFCLNDGMIREIVTGYTRESGVRNLEREIGAVCRKSAKLIVEKKSEKVVPDIKMLEEFLGPRKFRENAVTGKNEIGVVNGLAWTQVGGELLQVEVNVVDGTGQLELTGNLGDVMKESAKIAMSCVRSRCELYGIDKEFYKKKDIHIHFPEGAVPKDGPSAGITIATALLSALCERKVYGNIAMTGELSLRGRVLPIGGLKEKTMAAYRNGIKTVIIPTENEPDTAEIDKKVREGMTFILADRIDKVFINALLPPPDKEAEVSEPMKTEIEPAYITTVADNGVGRNVVC